MTDLNMVQTAERPTEAVAPATDAMLRVANTWCLLRENAEIAEQRVTLVLRRGEPGLTVPWLASCGQMGPAAVIGLDAWADYTANYADVAAALIDALDLRGRAVPVCVAGGAVGSFVAVALAAQLAEQLAPLPVHVAAFSLMSELYRKGENGEFWHPLGTYGLRNKPASVAAIQAAPSLRPLIEHAAAAGARLRVKAFTTPMAILEWQQALLLEGAPGYAGEEVLTDDFNHDMISWLMLPLNDAEQMEKWLIRWTREKNLSWVNAVIAARVKREMPEVLAWRDRYPNLQAVFDSFA
jgi:pimeloyl-ACP methyl ester carboxylesterase